MEKIEVKIDTEYIKLDQLLKFAGLSQSGAEAKMWIKDNQVSLNGEVCTQRGKKVRNNDIVNLFNYQIQVRG